jgi:hypothetical protein
VTVGNNMIVLGLYIVCISHITLKRFGLVLGSSEGYRGGERQSSRCQSIPSWNCLASSSLSDKE